MFALRRWLLAGLAAALPAAALAAPADDEAVWKLLQAVRHALTTPGVGDPPGMRLDDCASQRNLSDEGRRDAQRLGAALRERGVPVERVLASPWCRCIETARLAFGRTPETNPALGNLFGRPELEARQVAQLKQLVAARPARGNLFLVTHGSTTYALTGVSPGTGEMVVLTPEGKGFRVAGRLEAR
jgi:phosphohistidine phosphatase SixA